MMLDVKKASSVAIEEYALTHPTFATRASVWAGMFMVSAFGGWAWATELDVRAKGEGQVVTASQNQVIQNLEGGIVTAINVKNGDKVKAGQVLVQLSPIAAGAELEEQGREVHRRARSGLAEGRGWPSSGDGQGC